MLAHRHPPSLDDLDAAFDGAGCLGPWLHDVVSDRLMVSPALGVLVGISTDMPPIAVSRSELLAGIHGEDRCRIDSVLDEAAESGGLFEAEFRTRPGPRGIRWLRLMGRLERRRHGRLPRTRGLAFDLTDARRPAGPPSRQAQRQANQMADHVIAMKGLVADLTNPSLCRLVDEMAVEVGYELARRLLRAGGT